MMRDTIFGAALAIALIGFGVLRPGFLPFVWPTLIALIAVGGISARVTRASARNRWSTDYHGEWPEPLLCWIRSVATLGILDGHKWEAEWERDDMIASDGFEAQGCRRCGAVRGRDPRVDGPIRGARVDAIVIDDPIDFRRGVAEAAGMAARHQIEAPLGSHVVSAGPVSFDCPKCGHTIRTFMNRAEVGCGKCSEVWRISQQNVALG